MKKFVLIVSMILLNACNTLFAATVTLAWDHHPDPIVAGYNIYRSTTSGGPYTKLNLMLIPQPAGTDTPMYTDTTPSNSQAFYYVVRAVSTGNIESANSNEVVWNPPPSPPTNLRIVSFSVSDLLVDGIKVASGVPPIQYTIPRQAPPRSYQIQVVAR